MRCLLFICLLLGAVQSFALDRSSVEGYQLANGLQLILKPTSDRGHVSIRLVVGVGLDDFSCADQQLPHLLEHLLFSGTDDSGEGGLEERMQAPGLIGGLGESRRPGREQATRQQRGQQHLPHHRHPYGKGESIREALPTP